MAEISSDTTPHTPTPGTEANRTIGSGACQPRTPENRPWGQFTVMEDAEHYKLKHLRVNPGQRLSLQMHHQREEHWIIVAGTPTITVGEKTWQAKPGEYIHIPTQARHRIGNQGKTPAELVEVQLGSYFGEDDIVRFEDDYNRL